MTACHVRQHVRRCFCALRSFYDKGQHDVCVVLVINRPQAWGPRPGAPGQLASATDGPGAAVKSNNWGAANWQQKERQQGSTAVVSGQGQQQHQQQKGTALHAPAAGQTPAAASRLDSWDLDGDSGLLPDGSNSSSSPDGTQAAAGELIRHSACCLMSCHVPTTHTNLKLTLHMCADDRPNLP